jgi:hypothetical protein
VKGVTIMNKFSKELCKIGGYGFVMGAAVSLGYDIADYTFKKIQIKRECRKANKLLKEMEKALKPKRRKFFGKR